MSNISVPVVSYNGYESNLEFILVGMDVLLIAMDEMGRLTSRMDNKRDVTRSEVLIIFPSWLFGFPTQTDCRDDGCWSKRGAACVCVTLQFRGSRETQGWRSRAASESFPRAHCTSRTAVAFLRITQGLDSWTWCLQVQIECYHAPPLICNFVNALSNSAQ